MASSPPPLAPEDLALLERLSARVVELHLDVPAVLALESGKPLSLLASQAMLFFEPMVQALFSFADYRRVASLLERRDVLEQLTRMIEQRADQAHEARRKVRAARRAEPPRPESGR